MKIQKLGIHRLIHLIFIFLVVLLLTHNWFSGGGVIAGAEVGLAFYNPLRVFNIVKYMWWDKQGMGNIYPHTISSVLFYFLLSRLQNIGLSSFIIQKLLFGIILLSSGLSMYYLTSLLVKGEKKYLISFFAALFYMLNPYAMIQIWRRFLYTSILLMPAVPLLLALYIRGLQTKRISYAFWIAIISLLFSYMFGTAPYVITLWLIPFTYFIFHVFINRRNKSEVYYVLKFSVVLVVFWLLLNLWWLLPYLNVAPSSFIESATPQVNLNSLKAVSHYYRLSYILRGGLVSFYPFIEQSWGPIYSSFTFQLISFLIPVLVFSAVLFRPREKWVLYFASLALFGLFLAKGTSPPLGGIFTWLFIHFPLVGIFRNPGEKLGIMIPLAYAFLFGTSLVALYYWLKEHLILRPGWLLKVLPGALIVFICFLIMGVYLWPMWTGEVFWDPYKSLRINVKVPSYYKEADEWLSKEKEDFRILHLPLVPWDGVRYNWPHGYSGIDPNACLFKKPSVSRLLLGAKYIDDILLRINRSLVEGKIWKIMALLNTKYIIAHHDLDYSKIYGEKHLKEMERALVSIERLKTGKSSKIENLNYLKTFGKLDLYELKERYFLPHIYATNQFIFSEDAESMFFKEINKKSFIPGNEIIFLLSQSEINDIDRLKRLKSNYFYRPDVIFEKMNPTEYQVQVVDATRPFFLVFSETYHPCWKAYLDGEEIENHFMANGYANCWYIDKTGTCSLQLKVWPQKLFLQGFKISLATFIFMMGFLLGQATLKRAYHE